MRTTICSTALALAISLPASADVTMTGTTSMKGGPFSAEGATTTYIKGSKMRSDATFRGDLTSTIFDIDGQRMITINHKKKEAEIFEMAVMQGYTAAVTPESVSVKFTRTGESKTVAGTSCDEYTMTIAIPFKQEGMPEGLTMLMTGPVFVAKNSPAKADYANFYRKAVEKGFFFTQPAQAKAQPAVAKGWAALYDEMAKIGVAYETTMQVKFDGGGMMGAMLNKMSGSSATTTFTSISTDAIDDTTFEVPAGYKVKQSK